MNKYAMIFRQHGGVTSIVLFIISVIAFAIVINKLKLIKYYKKNLNSTNDTLYDVEKIMDKNIWILKFSYVVSPLLGILGTVLGLINAFSDLTVNQELVAVSISQALYTTAIGLVLAITFQFFYFFITEEIENILDKLEKLYAKEEEKK